MRLPLVTLAVLAAGLPAVAEPPAPNPVAATVNGEPIPLAAVEAAARRQAVGPVAPAQLAALRRAACDELIDDALVSQFVRRSLPPADPADIDRLMRDLADALGKQHRTVADFARDCGKTESQLRDAWADTARLQKYAETKATDAELRKYHAAYKEFFDRVGVRVRHIVARVGADAPPGERATAREKLTAVKREITAGTISFPDAAKKYSLDPSAAAGGDIGVIARKDTIVDEPFARAAFALKVGEVSDPVDTEFGVHLIQVTERTAGRPLPYELVADQVRDCYTEEVRLRLVEHLRKTGTVRVTLP